MTAELLTKQNNRDTPGNGGIRTDLRTVFPHGGWREVYWIQHCDPDPQPKMEDEQ